MRLDYLRVIKQLCTVRLDASFACLQDDLVHYNNQPIAVVVAETLEPGAAMRLRWFECAIRAAGAV